jgi:hypothetical protein
LIDSVAAELYQQDQKIDSLVGELYRLAQQVADLRGKHGEMGKHSELEEFIEEQALIAETDRQTRKDKRKFTAPWRIEE